MVSLLPSQLKSYAKLSSKRDDEVAMLTKACYGLVDAPRRRWKSLVRDTQQLGWRSCRHVPCLMTWHVRGRLKGLRCFHVDDIMISGPAEDSEFRRMMDQVKRPCEWERHEFDQCGCRIRQATDKSITADQEVYAGKIGLIAMSAHRCKTHVRNVVGGGAHYSNDKMW